MACWWPAPGGALDLNARGSHPHSAACLAGLLGAPAGPRLPPSLGMCTRLPRSPDRMHLLLRLERPPAGWQPAPWALQPSWPSRAVWCRGVASDCRATAPRRTSRPPPPLRTARCFPCLQASNAPPRHARVRNHRRCDPERSARRVTRNAPPPSARGAMLQQHAGARLSNSRLRPRRARGSEPVPTTISMQQSPLSAVVVRATQLATTSTLDAAATPVQHPAHCSQQEQDAWAAALSTRPASPQLRGTSHVLGPVAAIDCGSHCTRLLISAHGSELVGLALGRWL